MKCVPDPAERQIVSHIRKYTGGDGSKICPGPRGTICHWEEMEVSALTSPLINRNAYCGTRCAIRHRAHCHAVHTLDSINTSLVVSQGYFWLGVLSNWTGSRKKVSCLRVSLPTRVVWLVWRNLLCV